MHTLQIAINAAEICTHNTHQQTPTVNCAITLRKSNPRIIMSKKNFLLAPFISFMICLNKRQTKKRRSFFKNQLHLKINLRFFCLCQLCTLCLTNTKGTKLQTKGRKFFTLSSYTLQIKSSLLFFKSIDSTLACIMRCKQLPYV